MNYRLYTFVAGLYLSPLQRGLQAAHVVGELMTAYKPHFNEVGNSVNDWAADAGNHKGVLDCWAELKRTGIDPGFVAGAIFHEDEQSMNGKATALPFIVPQQYWAAVFESHVDNGLEDRWVYSKKNEQGVVTKIHTYSPLYPEGQLITHIKKYRLA